MKFKSEGTSQKSFLENSRIIAAVNSNQKCHSVRLEISREKFRSKKKWTPADVEKFVKICCKNNTSEISEIADLDLVDWQEIADSWNNYWEGALDDL